MSHKPLVALAVIFLLAPTAPAGEMDTDRPGADPAVTAPPVTLTTAPQPAGSELDRESPSQACFFFQPFWGFYRPFWGFYNPFGFGFNHYYTYSFFYRPFFPTFGLPYAWNWWGYGFDPTLIWY